LIDLVRVVARAGPRGTTLPELRGTVPWRPQPVRGDPGAATVALVQTAACLLAGDDVRIEITVGDRARLELRELGAAVVHHSRGGPAARLAVDIAVGYDATLAWAAAPIISAAGSALERSMSVTLASGGVALLRDATVLGRAGELGGRLDARLRATADGVALLDERLTTADPTLVGSPVMFGDARVLDSVILLGCRPDRDAVGVMELAGPGAVWRRLDDGTGPGMNDGDARFDHWHRMIDKSDHLATKVS
jgi:urease accessory protein